MRKRLLSILICFALVGSVAYATTVTRVVPNSANGPTNQVSAYDHTSGTADFPITIENKTDACIMLVVVFPENANGEQPDDKKLKLDGLGKTYSGTLPPGAEVFWYLCGHTTNEDGIETVEITY